MSKIRYREKCLKQKINVCYICGSTNSLKVHHIDGDRENNQLDNLIPVCSPCHGKVHTKKSQGPVIDRLSGKLPDESLLDTPSKGDTRMAMVNMPDPVRDELRKYKAEHGETYGEAVERLLDESGWYDDV